ncbi:hypothetical protein ASG43_18875 [Aureimonas sp. Leaf454]|nr:hypothetical protein ASG43_18875 [Aureimonas sp. Leaf454]
MRLPPRLREAARRQPWRDRSINPALPSARVASSVARRTDRRPVGHTLARFEERIGRIIPAGASKG